VAKDGYPLGKIVHITPTGAGAGQSVSRQAGVLPEIWASGLRNGKAWVRSRTGRFGENEHGPRGGDELTSSRKEKTTAGRDRARRRLSGHADAKVTHKDGMEEPVYILDPVIGSLWPRLLHGQPVSAMEGQRLCRWLNGMLFDRLTLVNDKSCGRTVATDLRARISGSARRTPTAPVVLTDSALHREPNTPRRQAVEAHAEIASHVVQPDTSARVS